MEHERFDRAARTLAGVSSRRGVVKAVLSGTFAAGLSVLGLPDTLAKKGWYGKKCKKHKECLSHNCGGGRCRWSKLGHRCTNDPANTCASAGVDGTYCAKNLCGKVACCRYTGLACKTKCDCCDFNGACEDGRCCRTLGKACLHTFNCCNGLVCANGFCSQSIPQPQQ
jgi:hypothetical protein